MLCLAPLFLFWDHRILLDFLLNQYSIINTLIMVQTSFVILIEYILHTLYNNNSLILLIMSLFTCLPSYTIILQHI